MNTFENNNDINGEESELQRTALITDMYENWFLDYASYVILERAVPDIKDGLKPVQRRLLHSMKELDDGRYNKVANIIGNTMKYHPHGDASIGDALVQLGQKDLLIDTQGNWGNILTGDDAAAPRYIEARLSKFALDVVFNPKVTDWKPSYDGRNKEPIFLPVKFPLLLAQGTEGIAVGLASKIFPHNFNELIDACIKLLNAEEVTVYPDFPTGGLADFSKYNDGMRGGRVKIRARIIQIDKKTLSITELPFGKTTQTLIESIISANDKGKIKIRKIEDNTAENVEILIHLAPGISPDQTIDALYAFTDCEYTVSPNACIIDNNKPRFLSVGEILEISNRNTVSLLKQELSIKKAELLEQLFYSSLEKIFIEKRIYRNIEKCETWESVIETIDQGLEKYKKQFYREITRDDIIKLTEIKIKRISKYDAFKTDEHIKSIEEQIAETDYNLSHLIEYAIKYYLNIKEKYGKGRERRTEIRNFDTIEATKVAVANEKLYVNREEGFAGTSLKKDEFVCDCSDIDDIIAIKSDGSFIVTKVVDKIFLGKEIIHIAVFTKNDDRTIYNLVYLDGSKNRIMVKRFAIMGVQRDKEYKLIKGNKYSKILYLTANPNGEAEVITIHHKPKPRLKKLSFDFDFASMEIKNKNSSGNILTKNAVRKIVLKEEGISTLSAQNIWYDDTVKKLNADGRGLLLGSFASDDKIVSFNKSGTYKFSGYDLTTHFDDDMLCLVKFKEGLIATAVYFENETQSYYIKRFNIEYAEKKMNFIGENESNYLVAFSLNHAPQIKMIFVPNPRRKNSEEIINAVDFISVKSFKAKGKRLAIQPVENIEIIEAEVPQDELLQDILTDDIVIENDPIEDVLVSGKKENEAVRDIIEINDTLSVEPEQPVKKDEKPAIQVNEEKQKQPKVSKKTKAKEKAESTSHDITASENALPQVTEKPYVKKKSKKLEEKGQKDTDFVKQEKPALTKKTTLKPDKESLSPKSKRAVEEPVTPKPEKPLRTKKEKIETTESKPEKEKTEKPAETKSAVIEPAPPAPKKPPRKSKKHNAGNSPDLFSQAGLDLD